MKVSEAQEAPFANLDRLKQPAEVFCYGAAHHSCHSL
ncbi:hypothetical protein METH_22195 (plasmid) [Leisingera methylohalidivorans DSM 14336]|uniref:Uncharacterized protein n=1 Tax=Leisingera methylohalidivorans DSM 14336 TaxID=999552 RepID=V9W2Y9_9RHOB|nr:hypothetical protein METH_22195 [Leisingera methylohalidivorans DSM 14336]